VLSELRLALRSGDIWVAGSRRYQPIDSYLIPRHEWEHKRSELAQDLEKPLDFQDRRRTLAHDLEAEVAALDRALKDDPHVEIDEDGQLRLLDPEEEEEPRRQRRHRLGGSSRPGSPTSTSPTSSSTSTI
jgi:hypothetical protein